MGTFSDLLRRRNLQTQGVEQETMLQPPPPEPSPLMQGLQGAWQGLVSPTPQNNLITRGLDSTGRFLTQGIQQAVPVVSQGLSAAMNAGQAVASEVLPKRKPQFSAEDYQRFNRASLGTRG